MMIPRVLMSSLSKPDSKRRLLIAGFGDLGRRLVSVLQDEWQCHALRRSAEPGNGSFTPVRADLNRPETLKAIQGRWDAIVYTATPAARTPEAYRDSYIHGLQNLLRAAGTERLIFVSSTAVMGQDRGEWVDEHSPTGPKRFNGRILLEAERVALEAAGIVVRFSGIYGPGRTRLIERVRSGSLKCRREPPIWTNRIHADDCARVLAHLLALPAPENLYLASDHLPATRWEVYEWLAEQLSAPPPIAVDDPGSGQGKRVRNDRLLASGFEFQYPNFREGYRPLIEAA